MKPFPCIESTLDITDIPSGRTVRLWINRNNIPVDPLPLDTLEIVDWVREQLTNQISDTRLIEVLVSKFSNINAIQILQERLFGVKFGTVVYTVPFDDVHG